MRFWHWALAAYARPGAAEACLRLQDAHGQNIPFLLWAAWARADEPALLARGAALARDWEACAVAPLRAVRRALKAPAGGIADADREGLRADVKAVELRAERVLMEALEPMAERKGGAPALQALKAAAAAWGPPADEAALRALADAFDESRAS